METPKPPSPIDLTIFREAIDAAGPEKTPCIFATCDRDGQPDLSLKGSALVLDPDHVAFWERSRGTTLENLQQNPSVAVLYRNPAREVVAWRFYGVAEAHTSGTLRDQVGAQVIAAELAKDPENRGIAAVIRVDRVMDASTCLQQR